MAKITTVPAEYSVTLDADEWRELRSIFRKAVESVNNNAPVLLWSSEESLITALMGEEFWDSLRT